MGKVKRDFIPESIVKTCEPVSFKLFRTTFLRESVSLRDIASSYYDCNFMLLSYLDH